MKDAKNKNINNKERKVFLDDLPRKQGKNNKINWKESVGYKVDFVYDGIEGEVEIVDCFYENKQLYLNTKYTDKTPVKIRIDHFQNGNLGKVLGVVSNDFKVEIHQLIKDHKRNITIVYKEHREKIKKNKYIEIQKWYKYICNKCGYEGWISESSLLTQKSGCSCCCVSPKIAIEGINTMWDTDRWMCNLGISEEDAKKYTRSSHKKIKVICPDCNREKDTEISISDIYNNKSIFCSCGDGISYPEKLMYSILKQINIKFITEYSPKWCKYKYKNTIKQGRYDFYFELNNKKYIIEVDGGFHKKDNKMSGQTAQESKEIDNMKNELAKEHDIEVIRINCEVSNLEFIKNNILNSKLAYLFDLSIVDWIKCEEFALSNRVKEVCELKRDNPYMSTGEISEVMKLGRTTIKNYLKKGSKVGWCDYDAKEEKNKKYELQSKQVEIYKNGVLLGVFKSCVELSKKSIDVFGVKLNRSNISNAARELKYYKEFLFKYTQ